MNRLERLKNVCVKLNLITVDDMGYSIPQLTSMLANKINELIDKSNLQYDYIDYLFNDGLTDEVVSLMEKWLENGTFESLINNQVFKGLNDDINAVKSSMKLVNVKTTYGVKGDGSDETQLIQQILDETKSGTVLYFPKGKYCVKTLFINHNLHQIKNIVLLGDIEKHDVYSGNEEWFGGGTEICYIGTHNQPMFQVGNNVNKTPHFTFENIFFKGCADSVEDSNFQKSYFMYYGGRSHEQKQWGLTRATNCRWWGFLSCFGQYTPIDYGGVNDQSEEVGQCCVNLSKCHFSRNKVAISNCIDSVIENCVFNLNENAIVLRKWGFANRIVNNRIEWNIQHGIYIHRGESIISNNEFDRNGFSGLHIVESESSIITDNKFLRNGSHESQSLIDGVQNVHIYAKNNVHCVFNANVTRRSQQWDDGSGEIRPFKASSFIENNQCVITNNVLNGGQIRWTNPSDLNLFKGNKWCAIHQNIMHDSNHQVSHQSPTHIFEINAQTNQYVAFNNIDQLNDDDVTSHSHKLMITVVVGGGQPTYDSTYVYEIPFILFNKDGNDGYVRGGIKKVIGKDDEINISIEYFDYFRLANTIGVTFRNNTNSNNKYIFRIE